MTERGGVTKGKNVKARRREKIQKTAEQKGCRRRVKINAAETEPRVLDKDKAGGRN